LANAGLPAADLATIARDFPELRCQVASHRNVYPDLLTWLDGLGDPAISAAVAARRGLPVAAPAPAAPAPAAPAPAPVAIPAPAVAPAPAQAAAPSPGLQLRVTGPDGHTVDASPGQTVSVGRNLGQTLQVLDPYVSGHHLDITWFQGHWQVNDAGSTNGTFSSGRPVTSLTVDGDLRLNLGDPDGVVLTLQTSGARPGSGDFGSAGLGEAGGTVLRSSIMEPPMAAMPVVVNLVGGQTSQEGDRVFYLGRAPDSTYVIDDVLASRRHAELRLTPDGDLVLHDLGSLNGTQVNGRSVQMVVLREGDIVTIGNTDLVIRGGDLVHLPTQGEGSGDLVVSGVDFTVGNNVRLLHDIDLRAAPNTLTALIGPSGAGKTTLGRLLTGLTSPSTGQVVFAGHDLHANYAALRSRIGFVPQDDVVHGQLTVRQALNYSAELRLPPDTSKAEREAVCNRVMQELGLAERAGLRVDKLSGGQRKRVSVAVELLTSPTLLVLDEPTSGLDPALDRQVMEMLKELARGGRIVVVVTHSLAYLGLTDQVLLLAPGGLPSYLGPPTGIKAIFGTDDWATVFQSVVDEPSQYWHKYLQRSGHTVAEIAEIENGAAASQSHVASTSTLPLAPAATRRREAIRQAFTLMRRQTRLIIADIGYFIFLAAMPVALGVLALVVPGSNGFGTPAPLDPGKAPSTEPNQLLMLLVLGACFMGASLTVRDLVGERPIFVRERSAGVAPSSYLISKLVVFGLAALVQAIILVGIVLLAKPHPGHGSVLPSGSVELTLDIALVAAVSMTLGLLVSSLARSSEQVMPLLVVLTMTQLVMSGGLVPITGRAGLSQLSAIFPARWGFAAGASTIDLRTLLGPVGQPDSLWYHTVHHWLLAVGIQGLMLILVAVLAYFRLRLRQSGKGAAFA